MTSATEPRLPAPNKSQRQRGADGGRPKQNPKTKRSFEKVLLDRRLHLRAQAQATSQGKVELRATMQCLTLNSGYTHSPSYKS